MQFGSRVQGINCLVSFVKGRTGMLIEASRRRYESLQASIVVGIFLCFEMEKLLKKRSSAAFVELDSSLEALPDTFSE